jgi:hypothetical protein
VNTDKLKELGIKAGNLRVNGGVTTEYNDAIAEIDAEIARLKNNHPTKFWDERSPEYQSMCAERAKTREANMISIKR